MRKIDRRFLLKCLASLALALFFSFLLTWLLEFRYYSGDAAAATDFVFAHSRVFIFSVWLVFLIIAFLASLTGSLFRGASFTAVLILIIGFIHINKFASRSTPLLPEDFQLASEVGSLAKFVNLESLIALAVSVVSTLMIGELLERWVGHFFFSARASSQALAASDSSFARRFLLIPRLGVATAALLLFILSSSPIIHHGSARSEEVAWLGTTFVAGDQTENYNSNGFLLGFLYNLSRIQPSEPAGYGADALISAKSSYAQAAANGNSERISLEQSDYNIVVILGESTVDPATLARYYPFSGGEVVPNLRRVMQKYPSGYMYSPDYGGGTANIEFEVLTGLTNYWLSTVPYTNLIAHRGRDIPSIASFARENGYTTSAVHSYTSGMYKRNIVLPYEGIDEFLAAPELSRQTSDGDSQYLNDQALYGEVLDILGRAGKQFVFAITMQTHSPYQETAYSHYDFRLTGSAKHARELEVYLQSLHSADSYLGEFIQALDESDEKTVVLFFGDHAPGILDEISKSSDPRLRDAAHTTPYFIYANFDLPATKLPTTTPNCLTNTMFNLLGSKKPVLGYLLDHICTEYPILSPLYTGDNLDESRELQAYELVTYDILAGDQYWME